jgi:ankyrin repeat protein
MGLCAHEYIDVAKLLVDAGADVNRRNNAGGHTAMWFAARLSNHDLMRYLVDHGADVNPVCEAYLSWTPLHVAIENKDRWAVRFLVERGANLNVKDAEGRRPIDLVEARGDFGVRTFLQERMESR